jgi:hypothetical protein
MLAWMQQKTHLLLKVADLGIFCSKKNCIFMAINKPFKNYFPLWLSLSLSLFGSPSIILNV